MKVVLVQWNDPAFIQGGWIAKCDVLHNEPIGSCNCVGVGVLIKEDDDYITLAPYLSTNEYAKGIVIPRGCIKQIYRLKVE